MDASAFATCVRYAEQRGDGTMTREGSKGRCSGWRAPGKCMALVLALLVAVQEGVAGVARFRAGGRVELPMRVEGDQLVIEASGRIYRFPRGEFSSVNETPLPSEVWPAKVEKALAGGSDERYEAVVWGVERGLIGRAGELLEQAIELDSRHEPTRRLYGCWSSLKGILAAPSSMPALKGTSEPFRKSVSDHLILLHQHEEGEARERLESLEDVFKGYYLAMAAHELKVELPETKLVLVWFARQADYRAFLRAEGAQAFLSTEGYYHPTKHFVAFYDQRSGARHQRAMGTIERERAILDAGDSPPRDEAQRNRRLIDIERLELVETLRREQYELGTAAHELVHLLAWSSGLSPRLDRFPFWLHEGLAQQFEVVTGQAWGGISRPHHSLLEVWRGRCPAPRLLPLSRDEGFGRGYDVVLYTQAWALTYFLRTQHPEVFVSLIDQLRVPRNATGDVKAAQTRALEAAWGGRGLASLEAEWIAFMTRLARAEERGEIE